MNKEALPVVKEGENLRRSSLKAVAWGYPVIGGIGNNNLGAICYNFKLYTPLPCQ